MKRKNREPVKKSSYEFFENGMKGHSAVQDIISLGESKYLIKRTQGRPDIKVLVADIYIMGEADIYEINPKQNHIECIVLIGFYNRYSFVAKRLAKNMGVALFDNREFFGAVNYTGEAFINYERKEKDN